MHKVSSARGATYPGLRLAHQRAHRRFERTAPAATNRDMQSRTSVPGRLSDRAGARWRGMTLRPGAGEFILAETLPDSLPFVTAGSGVTPNHGDAASARGPPRQSARRRAHTRRAIARPVADTNRGPTLDPESRSRYAIHAPSHLGDVAFAPRTHPWSKPTSRSGSRRRPPYANPPEVAIARRSWSRCVSMFDRPGSSIYGAERLSWP
jgi:hypothetical protein